MKLELVDDEKRLFYIEDRTNKRTLFMQKEVQVDDLTGERPSIASSEEIEEAVLGIGGGVARAVLEASVEKIMGMKIEEGKYDLIALDWAGIGDACYYSRLILQHIVKEGKRVAWISTPKVACLFKDDKLMDVFEGFYSPYRHPCRRDCQVATSFFDSIFARRFPKVERLHISDMVCRRYRRGGFGDFSELFLSSCNIKRDMSINYELTHYGEAPFKLPEKFIFMEHASCSFGVSSVGSCERLASNLLKYGVEVVYVGAKEDPFISGAVDGRGLSLYDTFSCAKRSIGIACRCSGNGALGCYLPEIPLFETEVPSTTIGSDQMKLHPRVTRLGSDFPDSLPRELKRMGLI